MKYPKVHTSASSSSPQWHTLFEGQWQEGWMHSGIAQLKDGRMVFEAPGGNGLIYLDPRTGNSESVEVPVAAAHNIVVAYSGSEESMWICDPGAEPPGQVVRINLAGKIVERIEEPLRLPNEAGKWRPTAIALADNGDRWIADGYGLSLVHVVRADGTIQTFDGSDSGTPFNCPHGIAITTRAGKAVIAVADRANKRLVYIDESGKFIKVISGEVMTSPSSLINHNEKLYVTDLYSSILMLDEFDTLTSIHPSEPINAREGWPNALKNGEIIGPTLASGTMNSPHGITVSKDGHVHFTDWCLGGRVVKLVIHLHLQK